MKMPKISAIIVIICLLIIGVYAMGEVNYFSSKVEIEKDLDSPKIIIPKINVEEAINNNSLNQGVLSDPGENIPTKDPVMLFGHRTLQGSPFLRLNELKTDDLITLEWPGIGELNYTVKNTTIVPETYKLHGKDDNTLYLITCDPIGSTENRLIVESELESTGQVNNKVLENNPHKSLAIIISAIFLTAGLILSYFYPKEDRIYILITILIISAILFYFCFKPIPAEIIYDKLMFLNGGF